MINIGIGYFVFKFDVVNVVNLAYQVTVALAQTPLIPPSDVSNNRHENNANNTSWKPPLLGVV